MDWPRWPCWDWALHRAADRPDAGAAKAHRKETRAAQGGPSFDNDQRDTAAGDGAGLAPDWHSSH